MVTVGLDIAKTTVEAAYWHATRALPLGTFANTLPGWEQLRLAVEGAVGREASATVAVVLEPTGGYELACALWALEQPGWHVHRPNPAHVRQWAKSQGVRTKTDAQDALTLASYGAKTELPVWQPVASEVSALEQLLHRRDDVDALLHQERRRLEQLDLHPDAPPAVRASLERVLKALEEERAGLEEAIAEHLRQHAELRAAEQRLLSVPGIGARTVVPVLVTLARYHTLTRGQGDAKGLVAYVGLDPQLYQSGTSVWRPALISRQGNRRLRARLYMGALGALRGTNPVQAFYQRLVDRGKAKKVALVAAARKMVVWAWAVFTSGEAFNPAKLGHAVAP